MDSLFENHIHATKELFYEAMELHFLARRRMLRLLTLSLGVLGLVLCVLYAVYGQIEMSCLTGVFFAYCMFVTFKGAILSRTRNYRAYLAAHPSAEQSFEFYEDHIATASPAEVRLEYAQISQVRAGKNICMLLFGESYMLLDKQGFTKGEYPEFKTFLESKNALACKGWK